MRPSRQPEARASAGAVCFDPFDWDQQEDPYSIYRRLRDEAPAYHNPDDDFWALSRYDDVRRAVVDHDRYCSGQGVALGAAERGVTIIDMDPPRHTQVRSLVSRAFTPRAVAALEEPLRSLSRELVEEMAEAGSFDFTATFSDVLPMAVISWMLGVPDADRVKLQSWINRYLHREPGSPETTADAEAAGAAALAYVDEVIAERRARPGGDLVSVLIAADEDGQRLTGTELQRFCLLLLIAGYETTTKLFGNAVYWLYRHPDQRARLVADPTLVPSAVEEVLRYDGATPHMARTLTADVELHGTRMPAGAKVLLLFASANRDERHWRQPDTFDVARNPTGHLGLGHGIHVCLGASVARLEMKVGLEELLARFPDYHLDEEGLQRSHTSNNRGFTSVPMSVHRGG